MVAMASKAMASKAGRQASIENDVLSHMTDDGRTK